MTYVARPTNRAAPRHAAALLLTAALAFGVTAPGCAGKDGDEDDGASGRDAAGSDQDDGRAGASGGGGRGTSTGQAGARGNAGEGNAGEGSAGEGSAGEGSAGEGSAGEPAAGEGGAGEPPVAGSEGGAAGEDSPASACDPNAQEHEHDSQAAMHVADPLPASSYNSSPPSSGPHCSQWGQYTTFADPPLPACNFLHNLEHGAIVLLYNCPSGCADVVAQLEQVIADAPNDPDCGDAKRFVLTPYTDMDATIAAAAWGYTFTADCLDDGARDALMTFIAAHQGSTGDAPEPTVCVDGVIGP